ncbi:MAG: hypothetical protein JW762_03690 [Dehalococcoidales bacterium]|nr:hypothetical protein [Dehalococcoidales bacterium]
MSLKKLATWRLAGVSVLLLILNLVWTQAHIKRTLPGTGEESVGSGSQTFERLAALR